MKLLVALIIIVGVVVLFNAVYGLSTFQGIVPSGHSTHPASAPAMGVAPRPVPS